MKTAKEFLEIISAIESKRTEAYKENISTFLSERIGAIITEISNGDNTNLDGNSFYVYYSSEKNITYNDRDEIEEQLKDSGYKEINFFNGNTNYFRIYLS